ncbi:Hypothetical predicted protein, partial [Olea europaea subsp. europaea]
GRAEAEAHHPRRPTGRPSVTLAHHCNARPINRAGRLANRTTSTRRRRPREAKWTGSRNGQS